MRFRNGDNILNESVSLPIINQIDNDQLKDQWFSEDKEKRYLVYNDINKDKKVVSKSKMCPDAVVDQVKRRIPFWKAANLLKYFWLSAAI